MNNSKCNTIMDEYLMLDKGERVPLHITLHLITCKECRKQIKLLRLAEKAAAAPIQIPVPVTDSTILNIMKEISPEYETEAEKNPITLTKWIAGGIIMIALMMTFSFLPKTFINTELTVSFYLLFAAVITTYCATFVGSNMDFFVKKINTLRVQ